MTNNIIELNNSLVMSNEATAIASYVAQIKAQITVSASAWTEIARLLASAADEFGLKSDLMRALLKQTNFSNSKAVKLIAIANSKRLNEHKTTFKLVAAWTVQYAITTLEDDEFERLLSNVDEETVITQSIVDAAKTKKAVEVDDYQTVFSIKISASALKAGAFDDYEELQDAVQNIQDTIKFVRVDETKVQENDAARFMGEVHNKFTSLATKLVNEEMKQYRQKFDFKKFGRYGSEDKEGMSILKSESRFLEALQAMGAEDKFDQQELYTEAQSLVFAAREKKYSQKLKAISAFAFANTDMRTAA